MIKKAFSLAAGLGTRFTPHTQFVPKPAMPFFNIPQILYPAYILKQLGVTEIYYNSHHLSHELEKTLAPFIPTKPFYEPEILYSAGGIANAKPALENEENFWAFNGDSLTICNDLTAFERAYEFHIQSSSLATLICVPPIKQMRSGITHDTDFRFSGVSNTPSALHFIGFYIFNKEIFNFIEPRKSHIFSDILDPLRNKEKISVFNLQDTTFWYETGNEIDFIAALKKEAKNLHLKKDNSFVFKAYDYWKQNGPQLLNSFLEKNLWSSKDFTPHKESEFLCVPENSSGNLDKLINCALANNLNYTNESLLKNKLLVDSSQWR